MTRHCLNTALVLMVTLLLGEFVAEAGDEVLLQTYLNGTDRGVIIYQLRDDRLWISPDDAVQLELPHLEQAESVGDPLLEPLDREGVVVELDLDRLEVALTLDAHRFPASTIDLRPRHPREVAQSEEESVLINYGARYREESSGLYQETSIPLEAVYRRDSWALMTDGMYRDGASDSGIIRLQTRWVRDDRERFRRLTLGDHVSPGGLFIRSLPMGGVSYGRAFVMDPYGQHHPGYTFEGVVDRPSRIEIYVDGRLLDTQDVPPGPYEIVNLDRYSGAGDLEMVITDDFGREDRIRRPFYLSDLLLHPGDHDFSYSLGLLREGYGTTDDHYGDALLSLRHISGITSSFTAGGEAEIAGDQQTITGRGIFRLASYGIVQGGIGFSTGSMGDGTALHLAYDYRRRSLNTGVFFTRYEDDFATLADTDLLDRREMQIGGRIGGSIRLVGSLSLELVRTDYREIDAVTTATLSYNRPIGNRFALFSSLREERGVENISTLLVNLTYTPTVAPQVALRHESADDHTTRALTLTRNTPQGEGYGYRIEVAHEEGDAYVADRVEPMAEYHGRSGYVRGEGIWYRGEDAPPDQYGIEGGGALVRIGGRWHRSRPVRDSFALVRIGEAEGVRVYRNAQEMGRTDTRGELVVPALSSFYDNRISFDDRDMPLSSQFEQNMVFLSPPYRSGSCIIFSVSEVRPLIGHLSLAGAKAGYLDYRLVQISIDGREFDSETGKEGEFYLDLAGSSQQGSVETRCGTKEDEVPAYEGGRLVGFRVEADGRIYRAVVKPPETGEFFVNLGEVLLQEVK